MTIQLHTIMTIRLLALSLLCLGSAMEETFQTDRNRIFSSQIDVVSPDSLLGELDHRGALFGVFPVGESITGNLYYTRRTLCGNETPGTPDLIRTQSYFLLVDRGGCSFVEKVRNAQRDNATAVLIADNKCLCSFTEDVCTADEECETSEPTMDDDGTGSDIRIPSMLVLKPDADRMKDQLLSGTMIQLQLSWPIPKAVDGKSEYTLWMTPDDVLSHQFLFTFLNAATALGNRAVFRPRMLLHDGTEKGCRRYGTADDPCAGYCTNYGRYCAPRLYYDLESYDNKGTIMLVESLRRACIWDIYGESNGIGTEWWSYVQLWIERCQNSHYSTSCAKSLFELSGINEQLVEQCMMNSGNFRENVPNTFLEQYLEEADEFDVTFSPTLFVNGVVIRGALKFGTVLEALCMSYEAGDIPEICYTWQACSQNCAQGKTCVLDSGNCIEYHLPSFDDSDTGITWNDDYIAQPETQSQNITTTTSAPTNTPTTRSTPQPTIQPTSAPIIITSTEAPSVSTSIAAETLPPVDPPTQAPIPDPTPPPVTPPTQGPGPDLGDPFVSKGGSSGISETIQIFEGGRGSGGGSSSDGGMSFAAGLGVGLGSATFVILLAGLIIRERRRNARIHGMAGKPIPLDDYDYDCDDNYDHDYVDEYVDEERPRRSSTRFFSPRRFRMPRLPRRTVHRSRRSTLRRQRRVPSEEDDEEEVNFQRREATLPLEPRTSNAARHVRTFRDKIGDDELDSAIAYHDDDRSSEDDNY